MTGYVSKKMLGAARLPDTPVARAYLDKILDDDDTQVYAADTAIVNTLLPKLYSIIDRLLDGQDKALVIEARRILPKAYKNSFEKEKNNGT
jgi:hypothetical protein